jgi:hypothetical protein
VLTGVDSIIAIKTSLSDPPSFVLIRPPEKTEQIIHIPGDCYPLFISFGSGKLVWVETHSDPRWENRAWSVIKIMDIRKKIIRQLSTKTRYMSASISPDGNLIAAVENTIDNRNNLVILDAWNGDKLQSISTPGNASLQRPQWDKSGKLLTVIFLTEKGEGIISYYLADKTWRTLIEAGNNDIQSSFLRNDSLFFVSSYSGTDNIYLCKPDKSVVPVTNSRFGVSDLNLNGYLLLFSLISSFGYEYSDNRHKLHSSIKWLGWYLVFETRMDFGNSLNVEKPNDAVADPSDVTNGYELTNTVSLPLSFRGGRFTKYLYLSASSTFSNDHIYLKNKGVYDTGQNQLTGRIYFSNYHRSALRDIYPKWAQLIDVSYSFYPFDKDIYGDIFTAKTAFYFPGFLKNNSLKVRLEAETQNPEKFVLSNRTSFSRSYNNILSKEIQFGSVDYLMPLAYPDFNLSSILYLTRIRTGFFYDYTHGTGNYVYSTGEQSSAMDFHNYSETFRSFGVQLLSDFYLFRIPFMITSGLEASWRYFGEYPYLKLLFNIDLYGTSIGRKRI